jgi:hypothetical protein
VELRHHGGHHPPTRAAGDRLQLEVWPRHDHLDLQVVDRPGEPAWTGKTLGIPAIHVYRLRPSEQHPGHTVVRTEESWSGLLARLARAPMGCPLLAGVAALAAGGYLLVAVVFAVMVAVNITLDRVLG